MATREDEQPEADLDSDDMDTDVDTVPDSETVREDGASEADLDLDTNFMVRTEDTDVSDISFETAR